MNKSSLTHPPALPKIAVIWGKWGPYHYARFNALVRAYGAERCIGVSLAEKSRNYNWAPVADTYARGKVFVLNPEQAQEDLRPLPTGLQVYHFLKRERVRVVFVPSYWPARALAVLLAARLAGTRIVMMNESHGGTERARGPRRVFKKMLLRLFDAGLVGGTPQVNHFTKLGMPAEKLFIGYDTVDNQYFSQKASEAIGEAFSLRAKFGLPCRYILNLGRMVPKKNLAVLIEAYALWSSKKLESGICNIKDFPALLLVGSGPEENGLRILAAGLGLNVFELREGRIPDLDRPAVFFGGFRQITENPVFYALADLFVLPSRREEWGLVVNEAMACGLPVLASSTAGCAADLVQEGVNGHLFDPDDPQMLSQLLDGVLSDSRKRQGMGTASRAIISSWGCELFAAGAIKATAAATGQSPFPVLRNYEGHAVRNPAYPK